MAKPAPLGGSLITRTSVLTALLTVIMVVLLIYRLIFGLGAVTNLSNGYGFGIWIAYDDYISSAFACGGFAMAVLCYAFNGWTYHPLVRPALVASAFGYSLAGAAVMFDVGRYWNAWHLFVPGWVNPHSFLPQAAICIGAFCMVLWVEVAPAVAERFGSVETQRKINKAMFVFMALGMLLATMHQSALGSMMIAPGYLVHPLWQTNLLPLLNVSSALCMGYSIVIFEGSLVTAVYKRPSKVPLLSKISRLVVGLCVFWLAVRWVDLGIEGKLGLVMTSGKYSAFFLIENLLFLLPIILLASQRNRFNAQILFVAAVLMLLAGSLYRLDLVLIAYGRPGWHYFPSVAEIMITVGFVALEILGYIVFVKVFPILANGYSAHGKGTPNVQRAPSVAATTNE